MIILLTVTFRNKELVLITESSMISVVCHICEPDIIVLNRFVLFNVEFVDVELVNNELSNIVDVVISEFSSVESFIFDCVELEFVSLELYTVEFVSIIEFVRLELFATELCTCEFVDNIIVNDEFWIVELVKVESCMVE